MDTTQNTDVLSPLRREWRALQIESGMSRDAFYDAVCARVAWNQGRPGQVVWGEAPVAWVEAAREVSGEAAEVAEMEDIERRAVYYGGGIEA